jgi:hypothetical protein
MLRHINRGEEFRIEIFRGKAKQRTTIALDNDAKIRRTYGGHRLLHAIGPMVIGRNSERPRPQSLVILAQESRRRRRGRPDVEALIHLPIDAQEAPAGCGHNLPDTSCANFRQRPVLK